MQLRGFLGLATLALGSVASAKSSKQPNILFILADDVDNHMTEMSDLPYIQKEIVEKGTTLDRHYCTVSLCCPSRATIWTGLQAHNHNITGVSSPFGGYSKVVAGGWDKNHLGAWMQDAGYNTYYTGKLYNGLNTSNHQQWPIQGYNQTELLLDPYTYQYYNISTSRNSNEAQNQTGVYSTDFIANATYEFLDEALKDKDRPWFITAAPVGAHCEGEGTSAKPPQPAKRHQNMFKDYKIPRTKNFNPDDSSSVAWISRLTKQNESVVEYNDEFQRQRLRSLQAVDDMVGKLVEMIDDADAMENTHIIFSGDNGYHVGQHRMHPGKCVGLETDINVPFVWRGPDIEKDAHIKFPTSHTDIAPTFLQLAGISLDDHKLDGGPIAPATDEDRAEHVQIEYWGGGTAESPYAIQPPSSIGTYLKNTYKSVRIEAEDYGFYYSLWCTNEHELYDMKNDYDQMNNYLKQGASSKNVENGWSVEKLSDRLDALLMVLKSCEGHSCTHPWEKLHPDGDVKTLNDAMNEKYDSFYKAQTKNRFLVCNWLYRPWLEGPQEYDVYGQEKEEFPMDDEATPPEWEGKFDFDFSFWND